MEFISERVSFEVLNQNHENKKRIYFGREGDLELTVDGGHFPAAGCSHLGNHVRCLEGCCLIRTRFTVPFHSVCSDNPSHVADDVRCHTKC